MTPKSNRGGRRTGAGRKPRLTAEQRLWIGDCCEQELLQRRLQHRKESISIHLASRGIEENHEDIQSLHPSLRHEVLVWGTQRPEDEYPADLPAEVVDAIVAARGNARSLDQRDGRTPALGRLFTPKHRRPARFREDILVAVSQQATDRFATPVSTRMVETAWKEYRRLAAELRAEVDSSLPKTSV